MKRLFLPLGILVACLSACGHKTETTDLQQSTSITWIQDKTDPMFQQQSLFPTVPDSLWEALTDGVPASMSCCLLQIEGMNILIDAGLGAPFSQLIPKLKELKINPDSLELIYITHLHPDHIGGLMHEGACQFPNAKLYINELEYAAWTDSTADLNVQVIHTLDAYRDNIVLFHAGDTLEGGVVAIAAYGHTPGHTIFQKDSILVVGDIMHGVALQLEHPEYCAAYDKDPETAIASRIRVLDYAKQNNLILYGRHFPAPGYIKF